MTAAERRRLESSSELSFLAQYRDHLLHELAEVQRRLAEAAPQLVPPLRSEPYGLES